MPYKWYINHIQKRKLITGEASPYYLFHPHAPRRILKTIPRVKLIALLRNPVDRALSQYFFQKRIGLETLSFKDALDKEAQLLSAERGEMLVDESYNSLVYRHCSYLSRGIYVDQLKIWTGLFPAEQLMIISTEDLFSDPQTVMSRVIDYLELPKCALSGFTNHDHYGDYPTTDTATRKCLVEYFKPHNQRLYQYLGLNFDWDR